MHFSHTKKECQVCATCCPFGAHFLQHKLNCFNLDEDSLKNIFLSYEATLYFINAYPKEDIRSIASVSTFHLFHSPYINFSLPLTFLCLRSSIF